MRRDGFACRAEQGPPGPDIRPVNACSAPVFDEGGNLVMALSMVDEATGFGDGDPALARLREAAAALSCRLGHRG